MNPCQLRDENLERFLGYATLAEISTVLEGIARELIARGQPGARNCVDTVRMLERVGADARESRRLEAVIGRRPILGQDCSTRPE